MRHVKHETVENTKKASYLQDHACSPSRAYLEGRLADGIQLKKQTNKQTNKTQKSKQAMLYVVTT